MKTPTNPPWLLAWYRALGIAQVATRTGVARRRSLLHRALLAAGVLAQHPADQPQCAFLDALPWGSREPERPAPPLPAGFDGSWPQDPVIDPLMPPPVLALSREERRYHAVYNAARYLGQALALTPAAALRARLGRRVRPVDAARVDHIITESCMAQFLVPETAPPAGLTNDALYRLDMRLLARAEPFAGLHLPAVVAWFSGPAPRRFALEAVAVGDVLLHRRDQAPAWPLACTYVLMGQNYMMPIVHHGKLHFPNDTINALTHALLPQGHVLYKLIAPFTVHTLGLDKAVMHHQRSVYHNSQRELYTPFAAPTRELRKLTLMGYRGDDALGCPGYRFGILPDDTTRYGAFLQDWYAHFLRLTRAVTARLPADDAFTTRWADEIARWVPGFPDGAALGRTGGLAEAVAHYLLAVSVRHSADHAAYARVPIDEMPMRLRVPLTDAAASPPPARTWVHPEDAFRHYLAHRMFFAPANRRRLSEVRFAFQDPALRAAADTFRDGMADLDAAWADSWFPASDQMACSIQY